MELNTSEATPAPSRIHHGRLWSRSRRSVFSEVFPCLTGLTRSFVRAKQPRNSSTHTTAMTPTAISQPACGAVSQPSIGPPPFPPPKALTSGMKSNRARNEPR